MTRETQESICTINALLNDLRSTQFQLNWAETSLAAEKTLKNMEDVCAWLTREREVTKRIKSEVRTFARQFGLNVERTADQLDNYISVFNTIESAVLSMERNKYLVQDMEQVQC